MQCSSVRKSATCHSTAVLSSVQLGRSVDTYPVNLVSVDTKVWVRNPRWASPVAETAVNKEHSKERHPKRSTNPLETPALDRQFQWIL